MTNWRTGSIRKPFPKSGKQLANQNSPDLHVIYDGQEIQKLKLDSLRAEIGMVLQETYLFNATVRENLSYARPNATLEQVPGSRATCERTRVHQTVAARV